MRPRRKRVPREEVPLRPGGIDFLETTWRRLTPLARLRRSWRMRRRLPDPKAVHDAKLWPKP